MPSPAGRGRGRILPLLLPALVVWIVAALHPAVASAADPTIEAAADGPYNSFVWRPSSASITPGGSVIFKSASAVIPHSVSWRGGPETPACSGVPIDEEKTSWSGSCTFAQPGSYPFVCSVHPVEMQGSISVGAGPGTPGPAPAPGTPESPRAGRVSASLKLSRSQRGGSVRGSIALSQSAAGGRLVVVLLSRRAVLKGPGHRGTVRVGRLVRPNLKAGRLPFRVSLTRLARRALASRERLALTVRTTVSAAGLKPLRLRRGVILRG